MHAWPCDSTKTNAEAWTQPMTPIAPRYRGSAPSGDKRDDQLHPILTIPDWDAQEELADEPVPAHSEPAPEPEPVGVNEAEEQAPEESPSDDPPVAGRLRETIHVYWSTAKFGKRFRLPSRLPEAVRGILPGVGIAISLIFVWFLINRSSNEPTASDMADQGTTSAIQPINGNPLRKTATPRVARAKPKPKPEAAKPKKPVAEVVADKEDTLFDDIPIIERESPAETVQQPSEALADAAEETLPPPTTVPPQDELVARKPITPDQPSNHGGAPSTTLSSTTEYEWSGKADPRMRPDAPSTGPAPQRRETAVARRPQQRRDPSQAPRNRQVNNSENVGNKQFTYESTDPSTYKDPIYNVPPIVGRPRQQSASRTDTGTPQATTRETPGRSRR